MIGGPLRDDLSLLLAPTVEELAARVARIVAAAIGDALAVRGRAVVALSGGASPGPLFDALAGRHRNGAPPALDDPRIAWFWADERVVPGDDPRRNSRLAGMRLLDPVGVPEASIHPLPGAEEMSADQRARSWEHELVAATGSAPAGEPPVLDLVLLGLGADGHTASLFPGEPAVAERHRWYVPARGPADGPPRVSLTIPVLCAAREVVFFVTGAGKRTALGDLVRRGGAGGQAPARRVRPAGRLLVAADHAAAGGGGPGGEG